MASRFDMMLGLGSAFLLLSAWAFQLIGGLQPCPLCYIQRWPHMVLVVILITSYILHLPIKMIRWGFTALMGATFTVAFYHSGVERGVFKGPQTCSGQDLSGLSADALFDQIMTAPVVRCSDITWEFLGLSMANWHGLACLALVLGWFALARSDLHQGSDC